MTTARSIGIVGGSGVLGGAIARGLLRNEFITPGRLWISNRSGNTSGFEEPVYLEPWPSGVLRWTFKFSALPNRCISVTAPHCTDFRVSLALLMKCDAMAR